MSQNQINTTALIILDGWGFREEKAHNGIAMAQKPFFDCLLEKYPSTLIDGSGPAVGLPKGIMGNSEVGHMNLGAGRIVASGLAQIYQAIENQSFDSNPAFLTAIEYVKKTNGNLHLMGLLSDGAVHSHQDHLYALLKLAQKATLKKVWVHAFLDGRDTAPDSGKIYVESLLKEFEKNNIGKIASLSGRYFAMDRDQRWDRVQKGFDAICGNSDKTFSDPILAIEESYQNKIFDEFFEPMRFENAPEMSENDAVIFFNFRSDRAREITEALTKKDFPHFPRKSLPGVFTCFSPYSSAFALPVAFVPVYPKKTIGEIWSANGFKQLRIAETEKYAHVTFFFNGGQDVVFEGEDRLLIPSPKEVATYDLKPEMSAEKVTEELVNRIRSKTYSAIVCNFANTDMVGHTAVESAIVKAVETVDKCLSQIVPEILAQDGNLIITADHGNAEQTQDEKGFPFTAHTTNLVPFLLISNSFSKESTKLKSNGRLCDVAPTLLQLAKIKQPEEMTGISLIESKTP